jgi:hypothetical protein
MINSRLQRMMKSWNNRSYIDITKRDKAVRMIQRIWKESDIYNMKRYKAVRRIQRSWKESNMNPEYLLCKNRLKYECDNLNKLI